MYSPCRTWALPHVGFPIRKSPDQSLFGGSPRLIAACNVLLRRPTPRHPPYALSSLVTNLKELFRLSQSVGIFLLYLIFRQPGTLAEPAALFLKTFLGPSRFYRPPAQPSPCSQPFASPVLFVILAWLPGLVGPGLPWFGHPYRRFASHPEVVEVNGLEPSASCVQGRRSPN